MASGEGAGGQVVHAGGEDLAAGPTGALDGGYNDAAVTVTVDGGDADWIQPPALGSIPVTGAQPASRPRTAASMQDAGNFDAGMQDAVEEPVTFVTSMETDAPAMVDASKNDELRKSPLHVAATIGDAYVVAEAISNAQAVGFNLNSVDVRGRSAIIYAVVADSLPAVSELMAAGCHVDLADHDGQSALHWSAFHGRDKILPALLQQSYNPYAQSVEGLTPLHCAAQAPLPHCMAVLVRQLVNAGQTPTLPDNDGRTPLHWCALLGRPKHLALLLKAGGDPVARDGEGSTPLLTAIRAANLACVRVLLKAFPAAVNTPDIEGRHAVHMAVSTGSKPLLLAVLKTPGVAIDAIDANLRTALHWACALGHADLVGVLRSRGASDGLADGLGATALHYASQANHPGCCKTLVKRRGFSDLLDAEGRSALVWAVVRGHRDVCRILAPRVNLDAADRAGRTALHVAVSVSAHDILKLLIAAKANVNAVDNSLQTALVNACEFGDITCVEILLRGGAAMGLADDQVRTALHWAAIAGHTNVVQALLDAGSPRDALDSRGESAVAYASFFGHPECAQLLLASGADPNVADDDGVTPLHWAALQGHHQIIPILLARGADPNPLEKTGDRPTPLDHALQAAQLDGSEAHRECAELLRTGGGRRSLELQDNAALTLQANWRGKQARVLAAFLRNRKGSEVQAAICIQRWFRRKYAEKHNQGTTKRHMAAAKIQALFRGNKDRKDNRNKVHKLNRRLSKVREDFKRREQAALQKRRSKMTPEERREFDLLMQKERDAEALRNSKRAMRQSKLQEQLQKQKREEQRRLDEALAADREARLSQVRRKMHDDQRRRLADAAGEAEKARRRQRSVAHQLAAVRAVHKEDRERALDARRPKTPAERQRRLVHEASASFIREHQRNGPSVLAPRQLYRAGTGKGGALRSVHLAALAQPKLRRLAVGPIAGGNHVTLTRRALGTSLS